MKLSSTRTLVHLGADQIHVPVDRLIATGLAVVVLPKLQKAAMGVSLTLEI